MKRSESNRKYYLTHQEEIIAQHRAYYAQHKEQVSIRGREYRKLHAKELYEKNRRDQKENKSRVIQWVKDYQKRYPLKAKAHQIAKRIKMAKSCEACGQKATDRHHPDYSKPKMVIFLCRRCHKLLHRSW